jgi:hypothetical protein
VTCGGSRDLFAFLAPFAVQLFFTAKDAKNEKSRRDLILRLLELSDNASSSALGGSLSAPTFGMPGTTAGAASGKAIIGLPMIAEPD